MFVAKVQLFNQYNERFYSLLLQSVESPVRVHFSASLRLPLIFSGFRQYYFMEYFDFSAMQTDNMADNWSGHLRPLPFAAAPKGITDSIPCYAS